MPTAAEALQYLGIDYADDMVTANVTRALRAAAEVVKGAVGDDVFEVISDSDKLKQFVLLHTADLYDGRGTETLKSNAVTRRIIAHMEWQLKLELRRAREAS